MTEISFSSECKMSGDAVAGGETGAHLKYCVFQCRDSKIEPPLSFPGSSGSLSR